MTYQTPWSLTKNDYITSSPMLIFDMKWVSLSPRLFIVTYSSWDFRKTLTCSLIQLGKHTVTTDISSYFLPSLTITGQTQDKGHGGRKKLKNEKKRKYKEQNNIRKLVVMMNSLKNMIKTRSTSPFPHQRKKW